MNSELFKAVSEVASLESRSDIPDFGENDSPEENSDSASGRVDENIPDFECETVHEDVSAAECDDAGVDETSNGESENAESNSEAEDDAEEKGYKNWEDVPHTTDDETGRTKYELKSGRDSEALNKVPPPPNAIIVVQDADGKGFTRVETDDRGRITKISRQRIELADKSQRTNETLQTVDKKDGRRDADGNKLDDGGHLVADEFGGASEETNLVPMDSEVNRHGEWRKMERDIEKELNKEPPSEITDFEVEIEYNDDSARPSGFTVAYSVNDGGTKTEVVKYISNERPEKEDLRNAA